MVGFRMYKQVKTHAFGHVLTPMSSGPPFRGGFFQKKKPVHKLFCMLDLQCHGSFRHYCPWKSEFLFNANESWCQKESVVECQGQGQGQWLMRWIVQQRNNCWLLRRTRQCYLNEPAIIVLSFQYTVLCMT